jgi:hypothetical protein
MRQNMAWDTFWATFRDHWAILPKIIWSPWWYDSFSAEQVYAAISIIAKFDQWDQKCLEKLPECSKITHC